MTDGMIEERALISRSSEETQALGEELAGRLEPGDLVAFFGDLGSGKTCMIQGICRGLEVTDYVTSPTFILINEYAGRLRERSIPVYHFDLYRLREPEELEDLGAEDYFYGQGICLIEWAEHAGGLLPRRRREIAMEYLTATERRMVLRSSIS
jgi:tRNA threonylcarbamoyladenosine biosynthesis protein TsaE